MGYFERIMGMRQTTLNEFGFSLAKSIERNNEACRKKSQKNLRQTTLSECWGDYTKNISSKLEEGRVGKPITMLPVTAHQLRR